MGGDDDDDEGEEEVDDDDDRMVQLMFGSYCNYHKNNIEINEINLLKTIPTFFHFVPFFCLLFHFTSHLLRSRR